ncbi:MAG: hypothetical protein CL456_01855 [Acidimicrobiaceae bacterium]|nr:hypothetical protein [Acidimicrobiaceae bacterium]
MAMRASQLMVKKYDAFVLVARRTHSDITLSAPSEPSVELHEPSVASQQLALTERSITRQRPAILLW